MYDGGEDRTVPARRTINETMPPRNVLEQL